MVTHALVDTAADVSIISEELFSKLPQSNILHFQQWNKTIVGVTGHDLVSLGQVKLKFGIGKIQLVYYFEVIRNLRKTMILGANFYEDFEAVLDYQDKTIRIGKEIILLQDKNSVSKQTFECALVKVGKTTRIPPFSYAHIPCKTNLPVNTDTCIISPLDNCTLLHHQPGVNMSTTLCEFNNGKVGITITNQTGRILKVSKNSVVATAEPVDNMEVNMINANEDATPPLSPTSSTQSVNIIDLVNVGHTPDLDQNALSKFLQKFKHLFALSDLDLGQTDLIQVELDTGDSPPIRTRPYRVPFSQRPVLKEYIDKMLEAKVIRPSTSPWSSGLVMVPKKDGTLRPCVQGGGLPKLCAEQAAVDPQGSGDTLNRPNSAGEMPYSPRV